MSDRSHIVETYRVLPVLAIRRPAAPSRPAGPPRSPRAPAAPLTRAVAHHHQRGRRKRTGPACRGRRGTRRHSREVWDPHRRMPDWGARLVTAATMSARRIVAPDSSLPPPAQPARDCRPCPRYPGRLVSAGGGHVGAWRLRAPRAFFAARRSGTPPRGIERSRVRCGCRGRAARRRLAAAGSTSGRSGGVASPRRMPRAATRRGDPGAHSPASRAVPRRGDSPGVPPRGDRGPPRPAPRRGRARPGARAGSRADPARPEPAARRGSPARVHLPRGAPAQHSLPPPRGGTPAPAPAPAQRRATCPRDGRWRGICAPPAGRAPVRRAVAVSGTRLRASLLPPHASTSARPPAHVRTDRTGEPRHRLRTASPPGHATAHPARRQLLGEPSRRDATARLLAAMRRLPRETLRNLSLLGSARWPERPGAPMPRPRPPRAPRRHAARGVVRRSLRSRRRASAAPAA